jgi:hypothetical protein
MNCPNCASAAADGAVECEKCGLVFSKWKALEANKLRDKVQALAQLNEPPPEKYDPWLGRAIAIGLVCLWMISLGLYFRHHMAWIRRRPLGPLTGDTAELRDPETGEVRQVPIRRGPGVKVPPPSPVPPPAD